jgi:pimeloyl-ACP methyl ester carboxylesterase
MSRTSSDVRPHGPEGAHPVIAPVAALLGLPRLSGYGRKPALVLINGLAEQAETWFRNVRAWRRHFDVHAPNLVSYDGAALHRRIAEGLPVDVEYLVGQLHTYLDSFAQAPPYFLVASSMGGKVAVEYAVRYPDQVSRLVLICPSGLGDEEQLPIVEGVRRSDMRAMVDSVFYDARLVDRDLVRFYQERFTDRRWRVGLLRTIRGTMDHNVRDILPRLVQPTLLVSGQEDRIVDPEYAAAVAPLLAHGRFVCIPQCGHAPQMEKAKLVNRLVVDFLTRPLPEPQGVA